MSKRKTVILSSDKINKILRRIAIQIVENNLGQKEIVLVGVVGQGATMAKRLKQEIKTAYPDLNCSSQQLQVDKENPSFASMSLDTEIDSLMNKAVVVVDDVMNTGRTQSYALSYILQTAIRKLETAVLVNRSHKAFPILATYSGIELSTTIDEHIEVVLDEPAAAYLY